MDQRGSRTRSLDQRGREQFAVPQYLAAMRILLAFAASLFALVLLAQTNEVVTLRDADSNVVNGTTVIVYGSPVDFTLEQSLTAELSGTVARTVNLRRHELNEVPGSKNYCAWGSNMFPPMLSGAHPTWVCYDPLLMAPQGISYMSAFYRPQSIADICCFQFVWYDVNSPNDSSWVNICFDTETFTSVQEVATSASISAYPNPVAGGDVTFTYNAPALTGSVQLVLFNALGERSLVRSLTNANGLATVPTSGLVPGVWFAVLEQNGRMIATQRLVVGR